MSKIVHQLAGGNTTPDAAPFDSLSVADIGDVHNNTNNLHESVRIETTNDALLLHLGIPLTLGDGPTITSPNLRALERKHGLIGLLHVDAHPDNHEDMFARRLPMAPPFAARRERACGTAAELRRPVIVPKGIFLNTPKCTKGH